VELSRFLPWYQVPNIGVDSCKAFCVNKKIASLVGNMQKKSIVFLVIPFINGFCKLWPNKSIKMVMGPKTNGFFNIVGNNFLYFGAMGRLFLPMFMFCDII